MISHKILFFNQGKHFRENFILPNTTSSGRLISAFRVFHENSINSLFGNYRSQSNRSTSSVRSMLKLMLMCMLLISELCLAKNDDGSSIRKLSKVFEQKNCRKNVILGS